MAAAAALAVSTGCARIGGLRASAEPTEAPSAESLSPEYDFLVARQLEIEGRIDEAYAAYQRAAQKDPEAPFLHRKLSQLAARRGELAEAIAHGERALALAPDDVDTRLLLGTLYRVRRDPVAAEAVLRGADGQPLGDDAAFLLYTIYVESERFDAALATARWIVEGSPESVRGWVALAGVYERMGKTAEAEGALEQALEQEPGNLAVFGALARMRRSRGDREGEVAVHRRALARHPHHHDTLSALADALIALNRTDEAVAALADAVRYHPEDVRSAVRLALLEYELGRYDAAAARLEAALAQDPEEHEIAYLLGLVRQRQDRDAEALEAFGSIPPGHRYYSDARTQMAVVLEARGDFAGALAEAESAREARPARALDLYTASLRAKGGDFQGAVASLEKLLAETPGDDELLYNLGVLHGEAGHHEDALRYMQLALAQNPDNAAALNFVGYTWAERGENLDQAEAMITRALELRPDDGYITDSLGWVYYMRARPLVTSGRAGDIERGRTLLRRALRELERAAELTGGDPVVAEHLGDVWLLLEDKRRALEFYENAIHRDPRENEQPRLREKYERLRGELGSR